MYISVSWDMPKFNDIITIMYYVGCMLLPPPLLMTLLLVLVVYWVAIILYCASCMSALWFYQLFWTCAVLVPIKVHTHLKVHLYN